MKKIVIYDFDGTLTPYPFSKLDILDKCGYIGGGNNIEFKNLIVKKMKEKSINVYNSYYETMFEIVKSNEYILNDDTLSIGANSIEYSNGVIEFLEYLKNNDVENYIISSGMKCYLDRINISKYFKNIYGTTFKYKNNIIYDLDVLITDDKKIDIIKNIMLENDINDCSNIIYIGDGLTDLPIMDYVYKNGGTTIYVGDDKEINNSIISYYLDRGYSLDGDIFKVVCNKFNI